MKFIFWLILLSLTFNYSTKLRASELEDDLADDVMAGFEEFDSSSSIEPAPSSAAQELIDLDESGFNDEPLQDLSASFKSNQASSSGYSLSGTVSYLSAYNFVQNDSSSVAPGDMPMNFSGLSRSVFKASLALEVKHSINWQSKFEVSAWYDAAWKINGRENYSAEVLDTYESFVDIKDAYIQGSLTSNLDLKFGRQIVIWGKSDSIRVTDVINPLDNRSPGMVDIEDLRLSEIMTRFDYYFDHWGLTGIVIHEPRVEIEAAFGSDYRPSGIFGRAIPYENFPPQIAPNWTIDNSQFAMSLDGHFRGWDLSYYAARVYDNRFYIKSQGNSLTRNYDKINMLGIASNMVLGSWLLKAESAYIQNIHYRSTDKKNRLDTLIGVDYMGIKNSVFSIELANRHVFNYEEKMLSLTLEQASLLNTYPDFVRKDSLQIALRSSFDFDHDNAKLTYLLSLTSGDGLANEFDGGFQRLWIDYKYTDSISLNAGYVDYIAGDSIIPFYRATENNDRLFFEIKSYF